MENKKLVNKYIKFNKLLLSTINIKTKKIDVFDGEKNMSFNYNDFFKYVSKYFDLNPDFIDKALMIINSLDSSNEVLEIKAEYKKKSGKVANFTYNFIKENDELFALFVKENQNTVEDHLDQMTKANPKAYIDNLGKNNILSKTPFILLYIDIDNFKFINDEYGQTIGDMILIEMVAICKTIVGDKGSISRVGGDRFLIIYETDDNYDNVHDFIFDLKQSMQKLSSKVNDDMKVTITIGCSRYPFDGNNYELLLRKSEKALIRGKNKGRDCFVIYLEEKCGKVTLEDKLDNIKKIDNVSAKNNLYSMITDVNQLLADDNNFDESITKTMSLVGSYLYVDRISIARLNIKTHKIMKHHSWYNPKLNNKFEAYCVDEIIPIWGEALGVKNFIKVEDVRLLEDNYPLKNLFPKDNTTASLSFELVVNGTSFGLIRFDMITGVRHWQSDDFQIFMLISQLLAMHLQKNYLRETNYSTLYLDPNYECNNFSKLFQDAGDYMLTSEAGDFAVLEFDVINIINYRSLIGEKRMKELVSGISSIITQTNDVFYGKKYNGPFSIVFKNDKRSDVIDMYNNLSDFVYQFSKKYHFNNLNINGGAYIASKHDRLIDAINNANLARNYNDEYNLLFYSDSIKSQLDYKNEMVLRIDEAIDKGEFLLYLQPKISTATKELIGAEALTRWNYKNERLLYPDEFISLFEEQGVIEKLDYNVFNSVCAYQRRIIDEGKKAVPISVNVSRYVANFDLYLERLESIRKIYNIDCSLIELEITEGMYFENTAFITDFIDNAHKLGYKVSLDDFGSGYSNLVSMTQITFDVIKFDKSFSMGLDSQNVKVMLLKLIELIKTMNICTVCEGVETKESVEYLTSIGCDYIQGYYYSKPISSEEFDEKYNK